MRWAIAVLAVIAVCGCGGGDGHSLDSRRPSPTRIPEPRPTSVETPVRPTPSSSPSPPISVNSSHIGGSDHLRKTENYEATVSLFSGGSITQLTSESGSYELIGGGIE